MLHSNCEILNKTMFPEFMGERHYMIKFFKEQELPKKLSRFQDTVNDMLLNIDTMVDGVSQPIFITIDEKLVNKGNPHRRSGVHIDGYWNEKLNSHGSGGHKMHCWDTGGWSQGSGGWSTGGWNSKGNFIAPESIVLASSYASSRGYIGDYENNVGKGGDCSHLDLSDLDSFILEPNNIYRGNVTFLHESIPVSEDIERTLVRLNIKNC